MIKKGIIRPATLKDYHHFYDAPPPSRIKCFVYEYENKLIGIGGLQTVFNFIFLKVSEDTLDLTKRDLFLAIKDGFSRIDNNSILQCFRDDFPNSKKLLAKMGFEYHGNEDGKEAYIRWGKQQ